MLLPPQEEGISAVPRGAVLLQSGSAPRSGCLLLAPSPNYKGLMSFAGGIGSYSYTKRSQS